MNRRLVVLSLVLLVALSPLVLSGGAVAGPKKDSAKGKGTSYFGEVNFSAVALTAEDSTNTRNAKGKASLKSNSAVPSVKGTVECLVVEGQNATVTGEVEESSVPQLVGQTFNFFVTDSGQRKGEGDEINFTVTDDAPCPPNASPGVEPIERGNIKVVDAGGPMVEAAEE